MTPNPPSGSASAIALAGLLALAVGMGIGRFAFTPILPMMHEDAGVSIAMGGWLASANYVGYLLGALSVIGFRMRATRAIRAGLVIIGLATLAMGLDDHVVVWIVLRAVAGVASAWVLISVSAWCLERLGALGRPGLANAVFAGVGAGIMLAGALCLALMHARAGSARAWTALGAIALVLSIGAWPVFRRDASATPASGVPEGRRSIAWNRESVRLVFCYGAFGFGYIVPATFLPVMARQLIVDPAVFGWSWPVFGAAAMGSTLGAAAVRDCMSTRRLWIASHLVMALGVVLPVVWSSIAAVMLAGLFVGGTFMVTTMSGMQEARNAAGAQATGLMAALTSAFAVGQIVGPIVVSYAVAAGGGFTVALMIACVVLVVSAYELS
jgi:predicted MFS family arabinose efflux permease